MLAQNSRPLEDDWKYFSKIRTTPISTEAQCVKEDGSVDLNVRFISQAETTVHERSRRLRGGIIEELRGQNKHESTLSEEKKERAINAFMRTFSLDALKRKFKAMMGDLFKPSHAEIMAESIKRVKDG